MTGLFGRQGQAVTLRQQCPQLTPRSSKNRNRNCSLWNFTREVPPLSLMYWADVPQIKRASPLVEILQVKCLLFLLCTNLVSLYRSALYVWYVPVSERFAPAPALPSSFLTLLHKAFRATLYTLHTGGEACYWGQKYYFPSVAWTWGEIIAFSSLLQSLILVCPSC